jgi:hypothetical protein
MLILIIMIPIIIFTLICIWALCKSSSIQSRYEEQKDSNDIYPFPQCKICRYRYYNITQEPCLGCDNASEFDKSSLEGQEDCTEEGSGD